MNVSVLSQLRANGHPVFSGPREIPAVLGDWTNAALLPDDLSPADSQGLVGLCFGVTTGLLNLDEVQPVGLAKRKQTDDDDVADEEDDLEDDDDVDDDDDDDDFDDDDDDMEDGFDDEDLDDDDEIFYDEDEDE